jgi:hypothetical protein
VFFVGASGRDQKLIRMRQQNTNFATKYKHYFFYNRQKKNLVFEGKLDEENQSKSGNAQMTIICFHT